MSGAAKNSPEAGVKTISLFVSSPGDVLSCWGCYPGELRSARRAWLTTDARSYYLGFRVGRTLNP
jgi:formylglycine-generating enzyme required for sulfatase activity